MREQPGCVVFDGGYNDPKKVEALEKSMKAHFKKEKKEEKPWYYNEDGMLKCFGKPFEYSNEGQSFHCAQLDGNECNEALRKECWKIEKEKNGKTGIS